jgi:hypothetical protein
LMQETQGHEVFASGWRHLVCLCLELKGYVSYDYDLSGFPNYDTQLYFSAWHGTRLTMRDAFPPAAAEMVRRLL